MQIHPDPESPGTTLNVIMSSFSIDVPDVCFSGVHPVRVETRLVKTREGSAGVRGEDVGYD